MSLSLLHQCGHNTKWNIDSFIEDDCGDGLILSPVHRPHKAVQETESTIKENSFFDPQYYLPNSQKAKLQTYDFFPEIISGGFSTAEFGAVAFESARRCVRFQIENNFKRLIIPARHFNDMVPNFTDKQDLYTVHPFLKAISEVETDKEVFLTLSVTSPMIVHEEYLYDLLNWATSFPEIDGVYFLVEDVRTTKQIQSAPYLQEYLQAVKALSDADLTIVIGHANTEGLLFSLIENCEITFGAYENTRIFSTDKFIVNDEDRRGPQPRIYLPGLLNWIRFSHASDIRSERRDIWKRIYHETDYAEKAFSAAEIKPPHFSQPGLYKHFFLSYENQVNQLKPLDLNSRYELIRKWLLEAQENYAAIAGWPLDLDTHGRGDHIQPWLDAINWYKRNHIS